MFVDYALVDIHYWVGNFLQATFHTQLSVVGSDTRVSPC